jgi:Saxitoxin biosynthesis operon protein SxtJ
MQSGQYHERLQSTELKRRASDRSFGLVIGAVFLLLAADLWWHGNGHAPFYAVAGVAIGLLALVAPRTLKLPNWIWTQFGLILHRLMSPVIISILFFLVITPIGWLMRLSGQRPLSLKFDDSAKSYWVNRTPPGPNPGTLKRQY